MHFTTSHFTTHKWTQQIIGRCSWGLHLCKRRSKCLQHFSVNKEVSVCAWHCSMCCTALWVTLEQVFTQCVGAPFEYIVSWFPTKPMVQKLCATLVSSSLLPQCSVSYLYATSLEMLPVSYLIPSISHQTSFRLILCHNVTEVGSCYKEIF